MNYSTLIRMTTPQLIEDYNTLVAKVRKIPPTIRKNVMPTQVQTRQIMLDELQRRAEVRPGILACLKH